jgi:hypothetical protein
MNAYLQRADHYIQQQMYKYEQKRLGRDYHEMQGYNRTPRLTRSSTHLSPRELPAGWSQVLDPKSRHWYCIERSPGRSQWEPPSKNERRNRHATSAY